MTVERVWEHPSAKSPGRWVYLVRINGQWGYGTTTATARADALHSLGRTTCKHGRPGRHLRAGLLRVDPGGSPS